MGSFQTSSNLALLLAFVRQTAYEAMWPSQTFPDWRDHFQLVGCIQCLKEVQYIFRRWIEELMKEENHFSHLWLLYFSTEKLQLLPWCTLTEDDISLYHFNTTSICSIMHNKEKNFDLERKNILIQWWLDQANYVSTSKWWCADQICTAHQGHFTGCHTPCNQKSSSVSYNSLMLTADYWQN